MCGIAGIIDRKKSDNSHLLRDMLGTLSHRGPDAEGIYIEDNVNLGHRRLKIIATSEDANQPFVFENNILVFNGAI